MLSQVYSGDPHNNKTVLVKRGPEKHRSNDLLNHEELITKKKAQQNLCVYFYLAGNLRWYSGMWHCN